MENHNLKRVNKRNTDMLSAPQSEGQNCQDSITLFENTSRFIHAKHAIIENQYGAECA